MPTTYEFSTEDVEYLRHGDTALKLRLYKPRGSGPFPAVIDLHGGAWGKGSLEECKARDEVLARSGLLTVGLDFRDGNHGYPSALVDINYAIRWLKARAGQLGILPDQVGLSGASSGGHLAMLAAMRPGDPRYAAVPLPAGDGDLHGITARRGRAGAIVNFPRASRHHVQPENGVRFRLYKYAILQHEYGSPGLARQWRKQTRALLRRLEDE